MCVVVPVAVHVDHREEKGVFVVWASIRSERKRE